MEDLSGEYDVDLAGNISCPLIGQLSLRPTSPPPSSTTS